MGEWKPVENPGTGWLASKTAGWTADRLSTATGGMAVDFSSVVPAGTRAVKVVVLQATPSSVWSRAAGDTEISNTPSASSEWSAYIMSSSENLKVSDLALSTDYRAEIAVSNTATDISVAYPRWYSL